MDNAPFILGQAEMNLAFPTNKESYDDFLGFSRATEKNWLSPDRKNYLPLGVTREEWAAVFLEPRLDPSVPRDVIRLYEVARGCMIYCWLFYPLATLGYEQLNRVAEFGVLERVKQLDRKPGDFDYNLKALVEVGVISPADEPRWHATGQLSFSRSHITDYMLIDPGQAITGLRNITDMINGLFLTKIGGAGP